MEKLDKVLNAGCQCGSSDDGLFRFIAIVQEVANGSLEWDHQWDKLNLK